MVREKAVRPVQERLDARDVESITSSVETWERFSAFSRFLGSSRSKLRASILKMLTPTFVTACS
jgi:hypothetical protein